ncbi:MAG: glutamate synthase subunit beta [Candidatus Omnitrophica bacterium]|nr:glutamate synthase subunit beta [Candidatus Omnitrophota bacterium]
MGKITGFLEIPRETPRDAPVEERLRHFHEFHGRLPEEALQRQGARCMDCGVPTCHWGCPLGNLIPDWNDLVYRNRWKEAIDRLHQTNNFPDFTGRVCPAPCEPACVLSINDQPVTIKEIERHIVETAFEKGWIPPQPPKRETGKRVAVVGSGPAGLAAAQQLRRAGHEVIVFEKADRIGGLLRYGIPDFKLEKRIIDRRLDQMAAEGVKFVTRVHVGYDLSVRDLRKNFDAVCLTGGAMQPRDLPIEGRGLRGIHFALEFLTLANKRNAGDWIPESEFISARDKNVVIIGGGDTGADCLGTALRQGARQVRQFEILPKPPLQRTESMPWPYWPFILRSSTSHEEGGTRDWCVSTKRFSGENGRVQKLHAVRLAFETTPGGQRVMNEIPGSEFEIEADLVLLAMGFTGPVKEGLLKGLGVEYSERGSVQIDENSMTNLPGIFAAGDMSRGASLVVWAIWDGRQAAKGIDRYLMGDTRLT